MTANPARCIAASQAYNDRQYDTYCNAGPDKHCPSPLRTTIAADHTAASTELFLLRPCKQLCGNYP